MIYFPIGIAYSSMRDGMSGTNLPRPDCVYGGGHNDVILNPMVKKFPGSWESFFSRTLSDSYLCFTKGCQALCL